MRLWKHDRLDFNGWCCVNPCYFLSYARTPQVLIDSTDLLVNILSQFVGVYKYIMSPSLAFISVTMIIAIFAFEPIYKIALWVLRKIPVFGVK